VGYGRIFISMSQSIFILPNIINRRTKNQTAYKSHLHSFAPPQSPPPLLQPQKNHINQHVG